MRGTIRARARTPSRAPRTRRPASISQATRQPSSRDRTARHSTIPPSRAAARGANREHQRRMPAGLALSATISAVNPRAPRAWGAPLRRRPAARSLAPRPRSPLLRVVPRAGFFGDLYADDGDHAVRGPPDPTTARALEDARRDVEASARARPRRRGGRRLGITRARRPRRPRIRSRHRRRRRRRRRAPRRRARPRPRRYESRTPPRP